MLNKMVEKQTEQSMEVNTECEVLVLFPIQVNLQSVDYSD
uniref:Uncharacterized protein n=1 Tax=Schistosoma curassoni TaxID=6186 RepID=A0A183KVC8_9TREM